MIQAKSVSGDTWDSLRRTCIDYANSKRASLVIAQLTRWTAADTCSDNQAEDDMKADAAHSHFGACGERAQNTCPGWPATADSASQAAVVHGCLDAMWNEGPGTPYSAHGHYINMSNTSYTELTCGFHFENGSLWVNMNFK